MSLKLKRTGAPCRVRFAPDVPSCEVATDGLLDVPDKFAQSFLQPDGSPDVGWEIVGGSGRLDTPVADAVLDALDRKLAAPEGE